MQLQRVAVEMKAEEMVLRVLYRSDGASNPGTKGRVREVSELARQGLTEALKALSEGEVTMCGTSGFTQHEDLLSLSRPDGEALSFLPATANTRSPSEKGA
jgi:hypothetical protein